METKNIRNIAILGHGNSGKTSLVESMLYVTGAIDRLGKVSDGNTVCDYDAEEIARQITISTAVAPVEFAGKKINVLDCPGYFDFVGDVLCALRAVEAGVIAVSAKDTAESVAVGAQRSWNYLKNANLPVMFTITKCREEHGDYFKALETLKGKYGSIVCPVTIPKSDGTGVIDLVHNVAYTTKGNKVEKGAVPAADADHVEELRAELMEAAAGATEELMEKFFETMELDEADIIEGLKVGVKERSVVPVYATDGMTNMGTAAMLQGVADYCPAPEAKAGDALGFVFKTVSDKFGKYSFIKVMAGTISAGMSLHNSRANSTDKLGRMYTFTGKKNVEVTEAVCGDIVAIGKMDWKTGDTVVDSKDDVELPAIDIPEPNYSMAIAPKTKGQDDKVAGGLSKLAEESSEIIMACKDDDHDHIRYEMGDLLYHMLVVAEKYGITLDELAGELDARRK